MADPKDDRGAGPHLPSKTDHRKKRKNGSSRNGQARAKPAESQLSVIERLLRLPVVAQRDGQPEEMSALEAIIFQLVQKSLAGDKKAERVRQKFGEFAQRNGSSELEVVFVDNDYTAAFAASEAADDV